MSKTVSASWYAADGTHGTTAGAKYGSCGPRFPLGMTFAEMQMGKALGGLPCGSNIRVTYQGKSVVVSKADIGGLVPGRSIDLFEPAARALGMKSAGVASVQVDILGSAKQGSVGRGVSNIGSTTGASVDALFKQYTDARDMQRTAPSTEFTGFDPLAPFKWFGNQFQQNWGYLFGDAPKGQHSKSLLEQGASSVGGVFSDVAGGINSALDFLKFIAWIFHPVNIARGAEFIVGIALMFYGTQAHYQAYREESRGGYRGSKTAVQRSAIGRTATRAAQATPVGRATRVVRGARAGKRSAQRQQYYREYDRSYRSERRKQETRETKRQARRKKS